MKTDNEVTEIAKNLIGTCAASPCFDEFTRNQTRIFDGIVFLCNGCGWWCSIDELNNEDGQLCDDCSGEYDD